MDYSLLKELIEHLEDFQTESSSVELNDFIVWINNRTFKRKGGEEVDNHTELLIPFRLMYLNKELKKMTKTILSKSEVSSIDEYSFLLHLDHQKSFRKMEIIGLHNLGAPTGIEIIKRLLKNDLVVEFADEEDRRAKRIEITKKGKKVLQVIQPKITEIFTAFTRGLALDEKILMAGILDKLIG